MPRDNIIPFAQPVADNIYRPLFVSNWSPIDLPDEHEPVDLYESLRNQRRLTVHPPIPLWEMGVMMVVVMLIGLFAGAVS